LICYFTNIIGFFEAKQLILLFNYVIPAKAGVTVYVTKTGFLSPCNFERKRNVHMMVSLAHGRSSNSSFIR
jgi:hypothetical protein